MPTKDNTWIKCPSVTYGGKPYFFVCFVERNMRRDKYTVYFDRQHKRWTVNLNDEEIIYYGPTAQKCKKWVEQSLTKENNNAN